MEYFVDLVLLFFSYSFVGWCMEVALKYFQYHRFINRGFLAGPWLPIYGSGCALITLAVDGLVHLSRYESSFGSVFAVSFVLCGLLEYGASWFMEKRFHARWWDYSQKPMNLNGRIWIGNLMLFGIGGMIVVKFVNPVLLPLYSKASLGTREIIAGCLSVLFISDYIVSHFVLKLVKSGVEHSEADNTEEIGREIKKLLADRNMFARRFAEAYPDVIYRTEKVKARLARIKEETERLRKEAEQRISERLEPAIQAMSQIKENTLKHYRRPTHIFLTGEKQVGKSTLVSAVLDSVGLKYSGLRSISVFDDKKDRNVFIVPANKGCSEPAALVGVCSNRHITEKHPEVFDDVGCRLLEFDEDTKLVIIDEIGNMERDAKRYSDRILELLDRTDIRILGIIQKMTDTDLARAIRKHPNVRMIDVNVKNREELVSVILGLLEEKK